VLDIQPLQGEPLYAVFRAGRRRELKRHDGLNPGRLGLVLRPSHLMIDLEPPAPLADLRRRHCRQLS
jgi:hypothetical protein